MSQLKLSYSSFQKWKKLDYISSSNLLKAFNFYFIFYFCSFFFNIMVKCVKKCFKKIVVLKSPFHYKLFKHHIMYKFYNIICIFNTFTKYVNFIKYILINFLFFNKTHSISISIDYNYSFKKHLTILNN